MKVDGALRVTMVLENECYPQDTRVRNEALALVADGHRVTVLAPRGLRQARRETVDGVLVERFRRPTADGSTRSYVGEYAVAHLQLLPRVIRALVRGADVVHVHNPPDSLVVFGLLARASGRAYVYDHHDLFPDLFRLKFGPSRLARVLNAFQWLSFRAATAVVVTNESQREVAAAAGTDPAQIVVVRNGPLAATLVREPRARAGDLGDPHLVFLGSLESQDGVLDLPAILEALRRTPGRGASRLTVIGDGGVRVELEDAFAARGLRDHVHFTGRVPAAEVPALLAQADVCVDPAPCNPLNHRSTMIKVGEYLAAGRPVVAYALEETRRTAGDAALFARCGDVGQFVELLDRTAGDDALRQRLANRGLERAEELIWERSADVLGQLYATLGGRSAPS